MANEDLLRCVSKVRNITRDWNGNEIKLTTEYKLKFDKECTNIEKEYLSMLYEIKDKAFSTDEYDRAIMTFINKYHNIDIYIGDKFPVASKLTDWVICKSINKSYGSETYFITVMNKNGNYEWREIFKTHSSKIENSDKVVEKVHIMESFYINLNYCEDVEDICNLLYRFKNDVEFIQDIPSNDPERGTRSGNYRFIPETPPSSDTLYNLYYTYDDMRNPCEKTIYKIFCTKHDGDKWCWHYLADSNDLHIYGVINNWKEEFNFPTYRDFDKFKEMDDFYKEHIKKKENNKIKKFVSSKINTNTTQIIQTTKGNGNSVVGFKMTQIGEDGCKQTQSVEFKSNENQKEKKETFFGVINQGFVNIAKIFEKATKYILDHFLDE